MSSHHFNPNLDEPRQWLDEQRFVLATRPPTIHSVSPWRIVAHSFHGSRSEIVSATGQRVAMVYRARSRDESHANARLLAATPMLRDSLEMLLSAVMIPDNETRAERELRLSVLDATKRQATEALDLASGDAGGIEMVVQQRDEANEELILLPAPH